MTPKESTTEFFKKIKLGNLFKALFSSILNLLILLIIYIAFTKFSQGFVLPLDMYMKTDWPSFTVNIFIFHFLLSFLALIMTLYPTYIFAFLFEKGENKYYTSDKGGLIYYRYKDGYKDENPALTKTESYTRKLLGISLFIIWSWVVTRAYNAHQLDTKYILLNIITIISTGLLIALFFYLNKIKKIGELHKRNQKEKDEEQNEKEETSKGDETDVKRKKDKEEAKVVWWEKFANTS